ncbi:MAG: anti-sigma factor antagonist [Firmicutes bacterium]|nr:anti-sigma factor antagonist [Bacillota bacterium]
MNIKYQVANKVLHIYLNGELSEGTAQNTRSSLDNLIDSNNMVSVVFHLNGLSFMDSTGIGVLIGRYKKLKQRMTDVYVKEPTPQVEKIFRATGLFDIMPKIS